MLSAFEASMEHDPDRLDASQLHPAVVGQSVIEPHEEQDAGAKHKLDEVSSTKELPSNQQSQPPEAVASIRDENPSQATTQALLSHAENTETSVSVPGEPKSSKVACFEVLSNSAALALARSDSGGGSPNAPTTEKKKCHHDKPEVDPKSAPGQPLNLSDH
eukprot:INCI17301.1.p1 GENE.INCI17301.1~~INCI17301.1.p1  ORF type:complete len:161 (-),score=30.90 INCI17301.1:79-561(-)